MKRLKDLLNSANTGKTDGIKRVKLPSGQKIPMPEHVTDYLEENSIRREDYTTENLNQPYARNNFRESKVRSAYMSDTQQTDKKPWRSGKIKRS